MADRYAVLVDAGAALSAGSAATFGRVLPRRLVSYQPTSVVAALNAEATQAVSPRSQLLRLYWYDGSPDRLPTERQKALDELADTKVRLGRISGGGQKGVDALMILDLLTLSFRGAITDAVVVTGDEDLLDAIEATQAQGVRVHLLATQVPDARMGHRTAEPLLRTADTVRWINHDFWSPLLSTTGDVTPLEVDAERRPVPVEEVQLVAGTFAAEWLTGATTQEQAELAEGQPFIPSDIDRELLKAASAQLGWMDEPTKRALRQGFWDALAET